MTDRVEYNIYCDESCHLEHDDQGIMVLGAISCPKSLTHTIVQEIKDIKKRHGVHLNMEIKWHKVSESKIDLYLELVDMFFRFKELVFRGIVVTNKSCLDHKGYNQTHDDFYYKMYFELLKIIINTEFSYNIYLDIKDSKGGVKVEKLHEILCTSKYDVHKTSIKQIKLYPSDQVDLIQICDLFIGALGYHHRNYSDNKGKVAIIKRIQEKSKYTLYFTTPYNDQKINLLIWTPNHNNH
jgi:hypothetical protein